MKQKISENQRRRLLFLALGMIALFSLLVIQFFQIQIVQKERWEKKADNQHYFTVKESFVRGTFYGNAPIKRLHPAQQVPLAMDIQKFHLYVDPKSIPEETHEELSLYLQQMAHLEEEKLPFVLKQLQHRQSRSRRIASWLDRERKDEIMHWWRGFSREHGIARNAIYFVKDYLRSYPYGSLLGQVLHTIQRFKNEETGVATPTGGLESHFHGILKGTQGKRRLLRSPRNRFHTGEVLEEPKNGADILLTIDLALQSMAEEEIKKGVKLARAKAGFAILMDPETGEIWAYAQYPFFHPERVADYFADPDKIEHTKVKAITDTYEPGSTIKPITLAILLTANEELKKRGEPPLFTPEERVDVKNGYFPGRSTPLRDTHPAQYLNMHMAMQKSSNIYLARLVQRMMQRLGKEWYRKQLTDLFAFGEKTNIELPGESWGKVPTPGRLHPNGKLEWSKPTPYGLAIGYNIQVTGMQMLRAWASLANGGKRVNPTFVREILNGKEASSSRDLEAKEEKRVLSEEVCREVKNAARYVTMGRGGGRRANLPGYTEVGKTGTAKKNRGGVYVEGSYFSTFMGFAPAERPRFLLLIGIDEPEPSIYGNEYGGVCAAPIFRRLGKRVLEYLGVKPDDPFGYPVGDPRYDQEQIEWGKETKALQEIFQEWNDPPKA